MANPNKGGMANQNYQRDVKSDQSGYKLSYNGAMQFPNPGVVLFSSVESFMFNAEMI